MSKFHISDSGVVGRCSAVNKCPFGGDSGFEDHFDSVREARVAYEEKMKEKEIPSTQMVRSKEGKLVPQSEIDPTTLHDQKRMAFLADSDTPKVQYYVARGGDEAALRRLAANPTAVDGALHQAYDRVKNLKTKRMIVDHPSFQPTAVTPKMMDRWVSNPSLHRKLIPIIAGDASNKIVASLSERAGSGSPVQAAILVSENSRIKSETRQRALAKVDPTYFSEENVNSDRFLKDKYSQHLNDSQLLLAAAASKKPETVAELGREVYHRGGASISSDNRPEFERAYETAAVLYRKPEASAEMKKAFRDMFPNIETHLG